jgi:hypothetical protein
MSQKSQKSNWVIEAHHISNKEEKAFPSMFGEIKK